MTRKTYSLEPTDINDRTWFYEEPKGLLIVHECRTAFTIPWRLIRRAVSVHEAIRQKKS